MPKFGEMVFLKTIIENYKSLNLKVMKNGFALNKNTQTQEIVKISQLSVKGTVQRQLTWVESGTNRSMWDMMTKFAPVPDFKIVCTRTQTIVFYLFGQSRLIQLL